MVAGGKPASQGVAKKPVTPAKAPAAKAPAKPAAKAPAAKPLPATLVAQKSKQTTPKGTATKAAIAQHAITYAKPLAAPKAAATPAPKSDGGINLGSLAGSVGRALGVPQTDFGPGIAAYKTSIADKYGPNKKR